MNAPWQARIRRIAFAAAFALSACASSNGGARYLPRIANATAMPAVFTFQTVDDPNGRNNRIMGIRRDGKIVGVYGLTRPSYHSFTSGAPAYDGFNPVGYYLQRSGIQCVAQAFEAYAMQAASGTFR